jgi:hypothetical protein
MTTLLAPVTPSVVEQGAQPYDWLALDIETTDARPEDAERECRLAWTPRKNLKTDAVFGKQIREALEKKMKKLALLDAAPIIVVSLKSNTELRCLHSMEPQAPTAVAAGLVEGFGSMADMLIALRNVLDKYVSAETLLVGHNITHFDMPKLRWAYVRHGLRTPEALMPGQPRFDTMVEYGRAFSVSKEKWFCALADVLDEFGIEGHKHLVSGAEIPGLYQEGRYDEIVQYALLDVMNEAELFERMTSRSSALK